MFSSTSFAGWTGVSENVDGDTYYVDFERIKKHDGYVYYWELIDLLKPNSIGTMSAKNYIQGDCKKFRYKFLSGSFHTEPMGGGVRTDGSGEPPEGFKGWKYPYPDSSGEYVLKTVCQYASILPLTQ